MERVCFFLQRGFHLKMKIIEIKGQIKKNSNTKKYMLKNY